MSSARSKDRGGVSVGIPGPGGAINDLDHSDAALSPTALDSAPVQALAVVISEIAPGRASKQFGPLLRGPLTEVMARKRRKSEERWED